MADDQKVCVICAKSCAGQARIKNSKGQYAHQACVKAKREQAENPYAKAESEPAGREDGGMAAVLADLDESSIPGGPGSCPGCGQPMDAEAIICLSCGFNRETGKQFKTRASKDRKPREESRVAQLGGDLAGAAFASILRPLVFGCVAGALGAAIWAGVSYTTEFQFSILAWGLGGLVGVGVNLGSRDTGGVFYGLIGAVIAIAAVTGGNYWTVSLLVDKYMEMMEPHEVPEEMIMQMLVDEIAVEWMDEGREIDWPREWMTLELAEWPLDYPRDLRTATEDRWNGMSWDEQQEVRIGIADITRANSQLIENEGFVEIMSRPRTIIWTFFAVCTAFMVAAYE